ncbi:MAG: 5-(carboxyamino)imidazole ribonucleotide synthase [Pseudomonadota bacterium]
MSDGDASCVTAAPGDAIGILGGGQLGRMLAIAAAQLGLRVHVLCPDERAPAREVAADYIQAAYTDEKALRMLAEQTKAITYEFENVPAEAVAILQDAGAVVRPGAMALEKAQDRLFEKEFIRGLGVRTADYHPVEDLGSLQEGLKKIGRPAILKTRRLGYDGKGQTRITDKDIDLHASYEKAIAFAWEEVGAAPSILEGFVPFSKEISIIGARSPDGTIRLYDPAENIHQNGILKTSAAPAAVTPETAQKAADATVQILEALDYIGVIGVEFFVLDDGDIVANEFAPRVHNSGHWTADACAASQFEQQIRAVAGWPLADPVRHSDAVMENLLGDEVHDWSRWSTASRACIHLYGKREARPGRKMGHVTRLL